MTQQHQLKYGGSVSKSRMSSLNSLLDRVPYILNESDFRHCTRPSALCNDIGRTDVEIQVVAMLSYTFQLLWSDIMICSNPPKLEALQGLMLSLSLHILKKHSPWQLSDKCNVYGIIHACGGGSVRRRWRDGEHRSVERSQRMLMDKLVFRGIKDNSSPINGSEICSWEEQICSRICQHEISTVLNDYAGVEATWVQNIWHWWIVLIAALFLHISLLHASALAFVVVQCTWGGVVLFACETGGTCKNTN